MAIGMGISAFVLLLLSVPIPFLGNYLTLLALALATVAALSGDKGLTIATTVLSGLKLFLFSPSWHFAMFGSAYMKAINNTALSSPYADASTRTAMTNSTNAVASSNHVTLLITLAFLAAPIAAMVFRQSQATPTASRHTGE